MVLTIYGSNSTTSTRRVTLVCNELGVPYEFVYVSLPDGEHKGEAFLQKQPFGQVPAIDDDGLKLYESRAISRYLAVKTGSPLMPKTSDLQAYAEFEKACSIEYTNFEPPTTQLIVERLFKPKPDENIIKGLLATLGAKLAVYDVILSKQKYLAGNELTLADLFHLPNGDFVEKRLGYNMFDESENPNVARWWKDISARPHWQSLREKV